MQMETPYQVPGETGLITVGARATSAATAGTSAVFLVPIPRPGMLLASLICKSNASGSKQATGLAAVTWARTPNEAWQVGATLLHAAYTANITAIAVGTPTGNGILPVTVTYGAGETNGSVDIRWRNLLGANDFIVNRLAGALENQPHITAPGFADSFTRADSASTLGTSEVGGKTWTANTGTWGVSSGAAYTVTGASADIASIDTSITDMQVEGKLTYSGTQPGLVFRYQDASNYYYVEPFSSGARIQKRVAGSTSTVVSTGSGFASGDYFGASIYGSQINLLHNGSIVATATDTALTAGTKAGMRAGSANSTDRWDDFSVASLAT